MLPRSRVTSCCRAGCVRAVPERMMSLRCCSLTLPCLARASHEMGVAHAMDLPTVEQRLAHDLLIRQILHGILLSALPAPPRALKPCKWPWKCS